MHEIKRILTIGVDTVPVSIIFSKKRKKSVAMQVTHTGVVVRAPARMDLSYIDTFIAKKESWILKQWQKVQQQKHFKKSLQDNNTVLFFGEHYTIQKVVTTKKTPRCAFEHDMLIIYRPDTRPFTQQAMQLVIDRFFRKQASTLLVLKTKEFAQEQGLPLGTVSVRTYRRKYGQCKGSDITYDWRIVQFPESVIDHIVYHELTHLLHKHHKKSFWDMLKRLDAQFDDNLKRLKTHGGAFITC